LSDKELIMAAANLARRAPEEWRAFVEVLETATGKKMGECVAAPVEMLQVAQGRAQSMAALTSLMKECVKLSDTIERKRGP